jgi:hypothetical protein
MTTAPSPARASAEMAFRSPAVAITPEARLDGMTEYKAKQAAELDNMAKLRAMRKAKGKSP